MAAERKPARRRKRGQIVRYDVSHVPPVEPTRLRAWRNGAEADSELEPGSFAMRVESKRVDLVALIKEGIPPREYHAHSAGMFVRGKRHLLAAPAKTGKSLACQVHWTRMALAGERVAILDRENGADVYAERLELIMDAWKLSLEQRAAISRDLVYIEYPTLRRHDGDDLIRYFAHELAAGLVVFDSQRMFLTDYGLSEKDTDDYALFMAYAIDPLHRAGITTVILDNTGHGNKTRGRGTSSKGDLNEVLFHLDTVQPFDRSTRGSVRLVLDFSRLGDRGEWTMHLGGGLFGEWQSSAARLEKIEIDKPEFKTAVYDALKAAGRPLGQDKLLAAVRERGVRVKTTTARALLRGGSQTEKSHSGPRVAAVTNATRRTAPISCVPEAGLAERGRRRDVPTTSVPQPLGRALRPGLGTWARRTPVSRRHVSGGTCPVVGRLEAHRNASDAPTRRLSSSRPGRARARATPSPGFGQTHAWMPPCRGALTLTQPTTNDTTPNAQRRRCNMMEADREPFDPDAWEGDAEKLIGQEDRLAYGVEPVRQSVYVEA